MAGQGPFRHLRRSCSARQCQLLGAIAVDPLPWESFEQLGREAEVVASVLQAALVGRESGINILLYGPPGRKDVVRRDPGGADRHPAAPGGRGREEGGGPARHERLARLRLAQRLAAPENMLLLFDEAADSTRRLRPAQIHDAVAGGREF